MRLTQGEKRKRLESWFESGVTRLNCLPFDGKCGLRWAKLLIDLRERGRAMPVKDSLIAASALVHGLTVATRNVKDFEYSGVKILNPFE